MARVTRSRVLAAACGCLVGAIGAGSGCVVAPPPELPAQPPRIEHASVSPPEGVLTAVPDEFLVPVDVQDVQSTHAVLWIGGNVVDPSVSSTIVSGKLTFEFSPVFPVGAGCSASVQLVVSDPNGEDTATWFFDQPCVFDAGALQDGAFFDAPPDALSIVGGDP